MRLSESAISVRQLVKRYDGRPVVDGLSFDVAPGELFALLGPNGAGKTTTVEILEGYRRADAGTARVLGLDPHRDGRRLKPRIGLMLQQGGVYPTAAPIEVLRLFAAFYARPRDPDELLREVGLEGVARTRIRRLSGGQKQRLSLALAIIGCPEVLFLDEPTGAMDPQARRATWELIRDQQRRGVTVLLTTHFMDEAEHLADRVAIVDQGRLVALDSPRALIGASGLGAGIARIISFSAVPGLDVAALSMALGGVAREEIGGQYIVAAEPTPALIASLTTWLRDRDVLLRELRIGHRTLEDVFLHMTGRELRD